MIKLIFFIELKAKICKQVQDSAVFGYLVPFPLDSITYNPFSKSLGSLSKFSIDTYAIYLLTE